MNKGYSYQIGICEEIHDKFVKKSAQANLLQSSQWSKVKGEWENERLAFFKDDRLVGVASVLIRRLTPILPFTMLYIPRGPIIDYEDKELVCFVLETLKEFGRSRHAIFIKCDPFLRKASTYLDEATSQAPNILAIQQELAQNGCRWIGPIVTLGDSIQPNKQAVLYRDLFKEEHLKKSVLQKIKAARHKGIEICLGREDLLEEFAELLKKTEDRKSISLRGKAYYQKLMASYPENAYILLAILPLKKRRDQLLADKKKVMAGLASQNSRTRANRQKELERLETELAFLEEQLQQGRETVPLAGTLTIDFGETSENIYAGMDDSFRQYQAASLAWLETARLAFERGAKWQNLGGVEPGLDGGLYKFKTQFNPVIEEYIGEFDVAVSPLMYRLFQMMYALRKKMRK